MYQTGKNHFSIGGEANISVRSVNFYNHSGRRLGHASKAKMGTSPTR